MGEPTPCHIAYALIVGIAILYQVKITNRFAALEN
jgi:hypothetical protein